MSADNAIYIRQLSNGKYAVRDCSYSDLSYGDGLTDEEIDERFEGASSFNTSFEAVNEAGRLEDESYIVEYGIISLVRSESVEGISGKYRVQVARTVITEYTFADEMTPEEAATRAVAISGSVDDNNELTEICGLGTRISVDAVTTVE